MSTECQAKKHHRHSHRTCVPKILFPFMRVGIQGVLKVRSPKAEVRKGLYSNTTFETTRYGVALLRRMSYMPKYKPLPQKLFTKHCRSKHRDDSPCKLWDTCAATAQTNQNDRQNGKKIVPYTHSTFPAQRSCAEFPKLSFVIFPAACRKKESAAGERVLRRTKGRW